MYCPLTPWQKEMYQAVVEKTISALLTVVDKKPDLEEQGDSYIYFHTATGFNILF